MGLIIQKYNILDHRVQCQLNWKNVVPRSNAGPGIWLPLLLPIAVIIGAWEYPNSSAYYQNSGAISLGMLTTTALLVIKGLQHRERAQYSIFLPIYLLPNVFVVTITLLFVCKNTILPSFFGGVFTSYSYAYGVVALLQACPQCFTFGEASVIVQAMVLFLYATITNLYDRWDFRIDPDNCMDTSTIILQVGWLGIGMICSSMYCIPRLRTTYCFYGVSAIILVGIVVPILHILLQASPILWILQLLIAEWARVGLLAYWALCCGIAILAVNRQIHGQRKASTVVRKYFHALAVAVFIPGLIWESCLLYFSSGIVMALFVVLELLRVLCMPPLGSILQDGFTTFADDKDQGGLSLTPMYLLGGCALPLWLHPAPSHATLLALLSGILAIGVGDTAASICGTQFGRHQWSGGSKTMEGTLGCFLSQVIVVSWLIYAGFLEHSVSVWLRSFVGIAVTSVIEAKTDQIDNLALPLVMYIVLL